MKEEKHDLYHNEIDLLRKFRAKIRDHAVHEEDMDGFSDEFEELIAQTKVITRVSDRLQRKLNNANFQIHEQNEKIKIKNVELEGTVDQLAKARVGRRAATIMLSVALALFAAEQIFLEPIIEKQISTPYLSYGILIGLFFTVKILESSLEKYFMNREKKKIIEQENKEDHRE